MLHADNRTYQCLLLKSKDENQEDLTTRSERSSTRGMGLVCGIQSAQGKASWPLLDWHCIPCVDVMLHLVSLRAVIPLSTLLGGTWVSGAWASELTMI
ncbi:hypothetical protein AOLI_G00040550 [Acnodon oligacanthus]